MGTRRNRISQQFRDASLSDLAEMSIYQDPETDYHVWRTTLRLATTHRLTVYDATYLELAIRRNLPLATLDRELRVAAIACKVELLGL